MGQPTSTDIVERASRLSISIDEDRERSELEWTTAAKALDRAVAQQEHARRTRSLTRLLVYAVIVTVIMPIVAGVVFVLLADGPSRWLAVTPLLPLVIAIAGAVVDSYRRRRTAAFLDSWREDHADARR